MLYAILINIFAAPDMPSDFNIYVAKISSNQIGIMRNYPLVADNSVTIVPLITHTTPILWKTVVPDAGDVDSALGILPLACTIHTAAPALEMRPHIARRMQHEFLNCFVMIRMSSGIRELSAHYSVNTVCRQHPNSQYYQHMYVRQSSGLMPN